MENRIKIQISKDDLQFSIEEEDKEEEDITKKDRKIKWKFRSL